MSMSTAAVKAGEVNGKQTNPPNQTLYCTNLNDKLPKGDLRRALYTLFSTYGPVLDVVALKTMKMRGQAHIVFRDVQTSSRAMRDLQGFEFFGKKMRLSYGRGKSASVSKLDGSAKVVEPKAEQSVSTELQKSIFAAPPKALEASSLKAPNGSAGQESASPQGIKRRRDSESDVDDTPMEEDDEDDAMDESDDD